MAASKDELVARKDKYTKRVAEIRQKIVALQAKEQQVVAMIADIDVELAK